MSLTIIDDTEVEDLGTSPTEDGTYSKAMGGTEMMNKALMERVGPALLNEFYIIKSRVRKVDTDKKNILWLHDLWADPEAQHLKDPESRKRFAKLVFVSNWQLSTYNMGLGVPYAESVVLRNAIDPLQVDWKEKPDDQIRLIYHTTPHRGLDILYAAVARLAEIYGDKIHLDVFSSFEAYGWKERDEPYLDLFNAIKNHSQMTYHGYQSNDTVREYLSKAHIFAYPNTWQETSCIAALEAMSAGCDVVCPNYAALPETTGHWARMYQFHEDPNAHANVFVNQLYAAIEEHRTDNIQKKLVLQKNWVDNFYNWDLRAAEWTHLLTSLKNGEA
jgi:UDP-glucose:(glucosyl)LPS alpha-1,2-glucosyltransferase